jgi:NAD(P)-dependent dehydrogenase (short-subunit alcohol dehydrogenase family)
MPDSSSGRTALVVGASRGLGLGLVKEFLKRDWRVVGTLRGATSGPLEELARASGGKLEVEHIDIVDEAQIAALRARLKGRSFDLLFVNAGVTNDPEQTIAEVSTAEFTRVMVTNALSPMRVVEKFEDLVPTGGTIGVMSSVLGSVGSNEDGGWEVYRASKAALNTLMRSFAARHHDDGRSKVIMHPGWVRTDMGGPNARLSIEESVAGIAETLTAHHETSGVRFIDYRAHTVPW